MSKNIRRGRSGSVRCGSCGQITRRDRAVYLFRDGLKMYYCPDCAKKIHGSKLFKGLPRVTRTAIPIKTRRKFVVYSKEDLNALKPEPSVPQNAPKEGDTQEQQPESTDTEKKEENQ